MLGRAVVAAHSGMNDFCRRLSAAILGATGCASDRRVCVGKQDPVILVHGICDSATSMCVMDRWLTSRGWPVHRISLFPSDGSLALEALAEQLRNYVEKNVSLNSKLSLVGFSMGGLVCRHYVQKLGGDSRVAAMITLSAPHRGTWLARLSNRPACRQMCPGSDFLRSLSENLSVFKRVRLTSIWTPFDLVILPPTSSRVSFARNQSILMPAHPLMILSRRCLRAVEAALVGQADS
jgi:triacylglycerol lipase